MHSPTRRHKIPVRDITVFAVMGTLMYISFALMQGLPGVHLIAVFLGALTLVYRARALIPLYIYIMIYGIFSGFSFWWLPYLYIWLPLWLAFMLTGRFSLPDKIRIPVYMAICALHGLAFGVLFAPAQALFFGLGFKAMIAWVIAGFWFDVIHAISNLCLALLIVPLSQLIMKLK